MAEMFLQKTPNACLVATTDEDREILNAWKIGDTIRCKVSKLRNPKFHRKYFALLNYAFEYWEPPESGIEINGEHIQAEKNFDRFRKDVAIGCGFYTLVVNIKNEVRAEAKSISFSSMDDIEFGQLYDKTISYLVRSALRNHTAEDVENVVNNLLEFA